MTVVVNRVALVALVVDGLVLATQSGIAEQTIGCLTLVVAAFAASILGPAKPAEQGVEDTNAKSE